MLGALRHLGRLLSIARTLARHDALAPFEGRGLAPPVVQLARLLSHRRAAGRPGQKLARALGELGPSFIKLGQVLSTRADLLGDTVAADLTELQDRLPPFDSATARRIVEEELGAPLATLFRTFDDTPLSAASIAQVHLAVTTEGRSVAVKVLRPGVEAAFARDLELLRWIAELAERSQPRLRRFKPRETVKALAETVVFEMDLRFEAAAASELAENFAHDPSYVVPAVDWRRTARRVLTLDRIAGIPIDDRAGLIAAGHDVEAVLTKAAASFFKQVFRDGFFHGDQHAGNMFVDADGDIVVVDFGIMGRLDHRTRTFLADMLLALLQRDYGRLAEVFTDAGYLEPGHSPATFAMALRSIGEPIFGRPLNEISFARLLGQLFRMAETFNMEVQPQLLLLQKNMLMAEGISRSLAPDLNIWLLAQPLIETWMVHERGPEARMRNAARDMGEALRRLPALLTDAQAVLEQAGAGGIRIDPASIESLSPAKTPVNWALWIAIGALVLALIAVA
jgi:ubiquinone biosynthesis protein